MYTLNEGVDADCEPLTEPPTTTMPPAPTHVGTGCCYGDDPFNASCFSLKEERSCDSAANCDWIPTEDVDECLETTTTMPPAPIHSSDGCCSGYSAQTSSYCNNFDAADQCESAGVCSWIDGGDDDDCTFTPPPPTTLPPVLTMTTTEVEGCCADECSWIEGDDDSPECAPPTHSPTMDTTGNPTMEPTLQITDSPKMEPTTPAPGFCFGDSRSTHFVPDSMGWGPDSVTTSVFAPQ